MTSVDLRPATDHVMALTHAFAVAARKGDQSELTGESPPGEATAEPLDPCWCEKLPDRLDDLATAWAEPGAWDGETVAGGVDLPAATAEGVYP